MPLITQAVLLGIADRAAYQTKQISDAITAINLVGGGFYFDRITATDDADVETTLIVTYENVDGALTLKQAVDGLDGLGSIVGTMDSHFDRKVSGSALQIGSWDGYCTAKDIRVSDYFNILHEIYKGKFLSANNTFSEGDDLLGGIVISSGPTVTFTDGLNYGDGATTNLATGGNFAATQLTAKVVSMGGTDLDIRLSVKDVNNNLTTIDVTIPASTAVGAFVDVGSSSDRFLDVTAAIFVPAGDTGTVTDSIQIRNKKERTIAL